MNDNIEQLQTQFPAIAEAAFPDNAEVTWSIKRVIDKEPFYCVEAEPYPATVGYPLFRFVLLRKADGTFHDVACYCLEKGGWQILYTAPGSTDEWKRLGFESAA